MKDKIEKIIEEYQLSSSKFADEIGVQRSSISHILSGRNKPSLEIVQRILSRFRTINAEWLILGKGKMFKDELPDNISKNEPIERQTLVENADSNKESENSIITSQNSIKLQNTKSVDKIIIFYSDKSFDIYKT